jgi:hypothetical protein
MSAFGSLHIAKVNLAAAVPHRVRRALGLGMSQADIAVGLSVIVDTAKDQNSNLETASVGAISLPVDLVHDGDDLVRAFAETEENAGVRYMYRIDGDTAKVLSLIPAATPGDEMMVHFFFHEEVSRSGLAVIRNDWLALATTLLKLVEVFTLRYRGASSIWWITALPWAHCFIFACVLQILNLGRDNPDLRQVDILSGELPSALHPGGAGKIVLGLPGAVRCDRIWKFVWGIGAIVNCVAAIATFLTLSQQSPIISYFWIAFQLLWAIGQILAFEILPSGPVKQGPIVARKWQSLPAQMQHRVMHLVIGLAKHQVTTHPRRAVHYQEDLLSAVALAKMFREADWSITAILPTAEEDMQIVAIVGDTLLRSCVWVQGPHVDNSEVYDCAMVFIYLKGCLHAVPCVRILARYLEDPRLGDKEASSYSISYDPRGTSNQGHGVQWVYWIPTNLTDRKTGWIEVKGLEIIGNETWNLVGDEELQERLSSGAMNVSLTRIDEVKGALEVARTVSAILKRMLKDVGLL